MSTEVLWGSVHGRRSACEISWSGRQDRMKRAARTDSERWPVSLLSLLCVASPSHYPKSLQRVVEVERSDRGRERGRDITVREGDG